MLRKHWHVCAWLSLACSTACSGGDEGPGSDSTGGTTTDSGGTSTTGGDASNTGGAVAATGGSLGTGGAVVSGGTATGGASGGATLGGQNNSSTGGDGTGGKIDGTNTGGASSGGRNNGGANTGGKNQGGNGIGGKAAGGMNAGGSMNTGGGMNTGGKAGGASTGGSNGGVAAGGAAGAGDCPEVDSKLCGMVAQHNAARANVMPVPTTPLPEMTWNTAAAAAAQAWADQCMFSHSTQGYGQNIYASTGSGSPSPKAVVDSWVSETKNYNYSANTCSGTCGHYTQVVWRNSTGVGCGVKACSTNSPFTGSTNWFVVVCNYSPPGNVNNQRPY
jgi:hypothetical protein